jgi:hypothetical protein
VVRWLIIYNIVHALINSDMGLGRRNHNAFERTFPGPSVSSDYHYFDVCHKQKTS